MRVIDYSPPEHFVSEMLIQTPRERAPQPSLDYGDTPPGWLDTFMAGEELTNSIATAVSKFGGEALAEIDAPDQTSPGTFNQYAWLLSNVDEKRRERLEPFINDGWFDDVANAQVAEQRLGHLEWQLDAREKGEKGPLLATILGSLTGAVLDPITYTPMGALSRIRTGSRLLRLAKGALLGGTSALASETALGAMQETRTIGESAQAVLAGGALGSLGGLFSRALVSDEPARRIAGRGVRYRDADGNVDVLGETGSSVGAAERGSIEPLPDAPAAITTRGLTGAQNFLSKATIAGRMASAAGTKAREIGLRLFASPILTDANALGRTHGFNAEAHRDYLLASRANLFNLGERLTRDTNRALGSSRAAAAIDLTRKIDHEAFMEVARLHLHDEFDEDAMSAMAQRYGREGAEVISSNAKRYAEASHELNEKFEQELVAAGVLRDEKVLAKLRGEYESLKNEVERLTNTSSVREPGLSVTEREAALSTARVRRDVAKASYEVERRKVPSLGRKYAHAQLYDRDTLLSSPTASKEWLMGVLARDVDEDWLAQNGFDIADLDDPVKGPSIREQWAGDDQVLDAHRAGERLEAAEEFEKIALRELRETFVELGWWERTGAKLSLQEARKVRDKHAAIVEARRSARLRQANEDRAFITAADAARAMTDERLAQELGYSMSDMEAARARAMADMSTAEKRLSTLHGEGAEAVMMGGDPARFTNSGDFAKTLRKWSAAYEVSRRAAPDPTKVVETPRLAAARARAKEAQFGLGKLRAAEETASERLAAAEARLGRVQGAASDVAERLAQLEERLTNLKELGKLTSKDVRAARKELRKALKGKPLSDLVDQVYDQLTNVGQLSIPITDRVAIEPGRIKARRLILTRAQRREAEALGIMRTDLQNIQYGQYEQLSGWLGLNEALKDAGYTGYSDWSRVLKDVQDEYSALAESNPARAGHILEEGKERLADLNALRKRLMGTTDPGVDRNGWVHFLTSNIRRVNIIRDVGGFLWSSFTDPASIILQHGTLRLLYKDAWNVLVRGMRDENVTSLQGLVRDLENIRGAYHPVHQYGGGDDAIDNLGIGARGTLRRNITGKVEYGTRLASKYATFSSGMVAWNRFWRLAAGVSRARWLGENLAHYASLRDADRTMLASLGIDESAARNIARQVERHGVDKIDEWDDKEAFRQFSTAISQDMNRSIVTPGVGDTPRMMDHAAAKFLLQYQTFAFAFLNRFMVPLAQRVTSHQDAQAYMAMGMLAFLSLWVVAAKDLINGKSPPDRLSQDQWGDTFKDALDRSGYLSYLSSYLNAAAAISAPAQQAYIGRVLFGPSDRYHWQGPLEGLLGRGYGTLTDAAALAQSASSGDMERTTQLGARWIPLRQTAQLFTNLYSLSTEGNEP